MLTVPWTPAVTGRSGGVTVIAARLPLRSVRSLPAAVGWAWRLRRALAVAPGSAGCSFAVQDFGSALWMVSAWTSRTELIDFERSAPHRAAKANLRDRLRPATFAVWSCPATELPVRWSEVRRRFAAVTPAQPGDPAGAM